MIKIRKSFGTVASNPVAMTGCVSLSGVDTVLLSLVVASVSMASPLDSESSCTVNKIHEKLKSVIKCSHDPSVAVLLIGQAFV